MRRLLAGALLLAACSDFVAPPRPVPLGIQTIAVGRAVRVALASGDSFRAFTFPATVDSIYSVEVVPGVGTVTVTVLDSIDLITSGFVLASSSAPPGRLWTQTVAGVASDPWLIRVGPSTPGQGGSVTITVHQVATGPEHSASTILLDSVYGAESLDAYDDIDRFKFTGSPGQLIEVFLQGTAAADAGQYVCLVLDPLAAPPLAVAFSQAGDTALEPPLAGRVRLFHGGQYLVEVKSSRNGCGTAAGANDPYLGPYVMAVRTIDTLPEVAADSLAVGDTVNGEAISPIGDIDVFELHGTPGQLVNLQMQTPIGGLHREIQVVVTGALTPVSTFSSGPDTSLDEHGTGRFAIPASGRVTVRASGAQDGRGGDSGPYRLYAYPVNTAPEHLPAAITPGDTIAGEAIDHMGDVDDFTFPAAQGQQFDAFFQVSSTSPFTGLALEILRPDSGAIAFASSTSADTGLLLRSTGRFTASIPGTYRVRVQGQYDQSPTDVGSYRFLVYPVNPAPETAAPVLAFGDSVSSEMIDFPGDVDEFHTVISDSSGANIVLIGDSSAEFFPLSVSLVDSVTGSTVAGVEAGNGGSPFQTAILSLAPCHCILRVAGGFDPASVFRGGYTLKFYKFSFGPEQIGDTVAIGDTVVGETINPPGDRDDFVFFGKKGQHLNLALEGLGAASPGAFSLGIENGPGLPPFLFVTSPTAPDSLHAHRSNRIDLPVTGWYGLTVVGEGSQNPLTAPGPYTVVLDSVAVGPEHGAPVLAAGDSVTNEAIDFPGDWDEFTLTGTPGQKVSLAFTIAAVPGNPVLEVFDSAADTVIASAVGQPGVQVAGPVVIPASGQLVVRVYEPRPGFSQCTDPVCNGIFTFTGSYQIVTSIVP